MLEGAVNGVAGMLGERNPQLHTVQNRGRGRRRLGMANAVAGGHEVHLAGAYQTAAPAGVNVGNLALEQPRHRLQPNVWVRGNVHPAGVCHVIGTEMVDETPGPNHGALPVRNSPVHRHRARATEWHLTGRNDLNDAHGAPA